MTNSEKTKKLLEEKLRLVLQEANIFGGGVFNHENDLNWAFQEIRRTRKPAGADRSRFIQKAEDMLNRFIPSLEAVEAGKLVEEIHKLTHQLVTELTSEFEAAGTPHYESLKKARSIAYNL